MRILIVEDEEKLCDNIALFLSNEGFTVDKALDGEEGLDLALENTYDCIVLDVLLPGLSGIEFCKFMRNEMSSNVPILMLTALGELEQRIEGLNAGADDYLPKPFDLRELLARINAIIRRNQTLSDGRVLYRELVLDSKRHLVHLRGEELELSAREFSILELFLRNPGRVFSREEITDRVWETGYESRSNIVDVYISYIRKKLENRGLKDLLETVPGFGYRLKELP
jgi:DNA-binding response OmpR family regulator